MAEVVSTNQFRNGMHIEVDGDVWRIVEFQHVKPGKGGAFVRTKLKGLGSGAVVDRTFRAGEKFSRIHTEVKSVQFLYDDGSEAHFMDEQSFEQFHLDRETLQDTARWLREGITLRSVVFQGGVVGIELPQFVEMKVLETGPGGRSDMASGKVTKPATLENGTQIRVPVYLEGGETVVVDTTTGDFVKRVSSK